MKKTTFFFFIIHVLFFFTVSCDKIEESDRLVISGANTKWEEGDGVEDKTQRTLIEKYTGVRCQACPTGEIAIDNAVSSMNGQLIAVSLHDSNSLCKPHPNNIDFRNIVAQEWSKFFGVFTNGQLPIAIVGRNQNSFGWALFNPATDDVIASANDALDQPNVIAVAVEAKKTNNDSITVTVNLEYLTNLQDSLTLTLFIMEDSLIAMQTMPDRTKDTNHVHNHILRDAITDPWGVFIADGRTEEDFATGTQVSKGTRLKGNFQYKTSSDWKLNKCHIVAVVSRFSTKRILNVAECDIN